MRNPCLLVVIVLGLVRIRPTGARGKERCTSVLSLLDTLDVNLSASGPIIPGYSASDAKMKSKKAWCATVGSSTYLQINFNQLVVMTGIHTQGFMLNGTKKYAAEYSLKFSYDGITQYEYIEEDKIKVFGGNKGTVETVTNMLNDSVMTRYLRIIPSAPKGASDICLRISVLGCRGVISPNVKLEGGTHIMAHVNKDQNISCSIESQAGVNIVWNVGGNMSRRPAESSLKNGIIFRHTSVLKLKVPSKSAMSYQPCEYHKQIDKYVCNSKISCLAEFNFNKSIKSVDTKPIMFTFDLPAAPQNMKTECQAYSCYLTWEQPTLGDFSKEILQYEFRYLRIHKMRFSTIDPNIGQALTPLIPNTNYTIRGLTVLLLNGKEISIGREKIHHFRTLTTPPKRSAYIKRCKALDNSAISISWLPPEYKNESGIVKHYQLTIVQQTYGDIDPVEAGRKRVDINKQLDPRKRSYIFNNLTPWSKYRITLTAYNIDGYRNTDYDNSKVVTLKQGAPSGTPRKFRVAERKGRSILVKWEKPSFNETNGDITEFEVKWRQKKQRSKRSGQGVYSETVKGPLYNITNLRPYDNYLIKVAAFTTVGIGPFTAELNAATDQLPPEAPIGLKFSREINHSESEYTLVWEKPRHIYGELEKYELNWRLEKGGDIFTWIGANDFTHYNTGRNDSGLEFRVRAINKYKGAWSSWTGARIDPTKKPIIPVQPSPAASQKTDVIMIVLIVFIVFLLILIILIVGAFILYRRRLPPIRHKRHEIEMEEVLEDTDDEDVIICERSPLSPTSDSGEHVDTGPERDNAHQPVPAEEFPEYVKSVKENDAEILYREYRNELISGKCYPWEIASKPENRPRNRYTNICAYDHSRVILKLELPRKRGDSDYINANTVQGYSPECSTKYIAIQGPTEGTVNDFWRLVWQEETNVVIMLTNLEESGKMKCYLYWPPAGAVKHGNITVRYHSSDQTADYHIRTFEVVKDGIKEKRFITQFHFISWPDHGVPEFPTALLSLRRRVRHYFDGKTPIICHCSAGVGRTGCFILIDAMIERIDREGSVDIFNYLQYMRTRRINMVQTLDQYSFAHDAILEYITCGNTEISVGDLEKRIRELKRGNGMEEEFLTLQRTSPDAEAMGNIYRVILNRGQFINAFHVDGYKRRDAFIVSASPTEDWTPDFWNMIIEKDCHTVVMLNRLGENEQDFYKYWPDLNRHQEYGTRSVMLSSEFKSGMTMTRRLKITDINDEDKEHELQHFQFLDWPDGGIPNNRSSLLALMSLVEKSQQHLGNGPVVIHCSNGSGRSGTFAAVYNSTERLKVEQLIDVLQCVRAIRISLANAVENMNQYQFIYNMIRTYLEAFETYSNFVIDTTGRKSRSPEHEVKEKTSEI